MKRLMLLILLQAFAWQLFAPGSKSLAIEQGRIVIDPFLVLWDHVKWVETRDSTLINPDEKAYGKGQITPVKLREFNKKTGHSYKLTDCLKESVSCEIFLWHCKNYDTFELAAKRWNGSGPATIIYWNKIQTLPLLEYRLRFIKLWKPITLKMSSMDVDLLSL